MARKILHVNLCLQLIKWPVHGPATGIDVEISGALNCGEEAMASYYGGARNS